MDDLKRWAHKQNHLDEVIVVYESEEKAIAAMKRWEAKSDVKGPDWAFSTASLRRRRGKL